MDARRFDNWTRKRALRFSRRDALRVGGAGTAIAVFDLSGQPAQAQPTCSLTLQALTSAGPSAPVAYDGTLLLTLDRDGAITDAIFTSIDGVSASVAGQATGRNLDLQITLPGGQTLSLSGAANQPFSPCVEAANGLFNGPQPGDLGAWQMAAKSSPAGANPSGATSGSQSSSSDSGQSSQDCPPPQTLCGSTCCPSGATCTDAATGTCVSACLADGASCRSSTDCCSRACNPNTQLCGCAQLGQSCSDDLECCEGTPVICFAGACCILDGFACTADADCCDYLQANGSCVDGICKRACRPDGMSCQSSTDCCSKACNPNTQVCGCAQRGQSCSDNLECCEGTPVICFAGACCILNGFACTADADCCDYLQGNGSCAAGVCTRTG